MTNLITAKQLWRNLWHSFRWGKRYLTIAETLAWIGGYSPESRDVIEKLIQPSPRPINRRLIEKKLDIAIAKYGIQKVKQV